MRVNLMMKLAIAVAVSFTGFLYSSYNRSRRITQIPSEISSEEDCKKDDLCLSEKIGGCFGTSIEGNYGLGDGVLLPEFVDLINEFESSYSQPVVSPIKPEAYTDIQLLEYYGLKEMETVFVELQNRLRASETENRRLLSQAASHSKTITELESAAEEIMFLKNKIRTCEEENREHILMLQRRLMKLKDTTTRHVVGDSYTELREMNITLQVENSDLVKRIELAQSMPSSICSSSEMEEMNGENRKLAEENERLAKEVEQLLTHRCADVEELVYLRWLNACFRYELREYKPRSGGLSAKELGRARSPRSEAKVKQLIFEYSKSYPSVDFDFDFDLSSSHASLTVTDFEECEERSVRPSFPVVRNSSARGKLFAAIRSVLRGRQRSFERPTA